ncbi:MAG: FAD-dependent oxidoreductase [Lentisphaeria bacterium]|nr:FAD-dependent oxidoreductase [Lentisphaeria bacterium]
MDTDRGVDLIVAGATLGGCFTALAAARRGARVALVEASPFLGTDITAVLRPWIGGVPGPDPVGQGLRGLLLPADESVEANVDLAGLPADWPEETPLFRGSVRKRLFEELDAAGVTTLPMCTPAGVLCTGAAVSGLLAACKQGLMLLRAPVLVDCTAGADVIRLWQPSLAPMPVQRRCHFTVGFSGAAWPPGHALAADPELGLAEDRVTFHAGRNSACSLYAEFAMDLPAGMPALPAGEKQERAARGPLLRAWRAWAEHRLRHTSMALTRHLVRHAPGFAKATLAEIAHTFLPPAPPRPPADALPGGLMRGTPGLDVEVSWDTLATLRQEAERWADRAVAAAAGAARGVSAAAIRSGTACLPLERCALSPWEDPALGVPAEQVRLRSYAGIPVADSCDVLVAGGGTAGANTAAAALDEGADTVLLEQLPDLGGTQTLGLVSGYYHGYRGGRTAALNDRVTALGQDLHNGRQGNVRIVKALHYLMQVTEKGGRWYPGTVVCGAEVEGARVGGLLAADRDGLFLVRAKVTVDATGDGDAAVFCGVRATFGDPRSGTAQDCSQWGLGVGGWESRSLDLDVIDQRLLSEVLRGLRLAHRRGRWFDFAAMLTVREGRHIEGETTLDLRDVLRGRRFDDTIAVACTDWDPHGISTSWLGRLGFLPVHTDPMPLRIPLGCCIPKGRSGLLVTAKAISATPDAACLCRMAADVQNLGYATGLVAARAVRHDGDPRRVSVPELGARLRALGIVTEEVPGTWPAAVDPAAAVRRLAEGDEMTLREVAVLEPSEAVPLLRAEWARGGADRLPLAEALAWFGALPDGGLLLEAFEGLAASEPLPYDDTHPRKAGNPRAGIVDQPDAYWRINQLLVLIGLARAAEATAAVAGLIDRTTAGGPPRRTLNAYIEGRIDMQRVPHFDRLLSIAFCAERLGDPRLAPPLERLLEREWIGGWMRASIEEAGPAYHSALVEVHLAAAAARCGGRQGALRLAAFLDDIHSILRGFARRELEEITGREIEATRPAWEAWLQSPPELPPHPLPVSERVF